MIKLSTNYENIIDYLKDQYDLWIDSLECSNNTARTYKAILNLYFTYLKDQNQKFPTETNLSSYYFSLKDTLKPNTIKIYFTVIKEFFNFCEQKNIYPNIARKIKIRISPNEKYNKKDPLTIEEVKKLLNSIDCRAFKGIRDYTIILLMVVTGLRINSVSNIKICDILEYKDQTILRYLNKGHDKKDCYVEIPEQLLNPLKTYLEKYSILFGPITPNDPLFISTAKNKKNKKQSLSTRSIRKIIKDRLKNIGIDSDRITPHSLRHTAATIAQECGANLADIQRLLGHSNISGTTVYLHGFKKSENANPERVIGDALFK